MREHWIWWSICLSILLVGPPDVAVADDPKVGGWEKIGSMTHARSRHDAIQISPTEVLLIGGVRGGGTLNADVERFDAETGETEVVGSLPEGIEYAKAVELPDGRLATLGFDFEDNQKMATFDPSTGEATALTPPPYDGIRAGFAVTGRGNLLVVGGAKETGSRPIEFETLGDAYLYEMDSGSWTSLGQLAQARKYPDAATLPDGRVMIVGGAPSEDVDNVTKIEVYDPEDQSLDVAGSFPDDVYFNDPNIEVMSETWALVVTEDDIWSIDLASFETKKNTVPRGPQQRSGCRLRPVTRPLVRLAASRDVDVPPGRRRGDRSRGARSVS